MVRFNTQIGKKELLKVEIFSNILYGFRYFLYIIISYLNVKHYDNDCKQNEYLLNP